MKNIKKILMTLFCVTASVCVFSACQLGGSSSSSEETQSQQSEVSEGGESDSNDSQEEDNSSSDGGDAEETTYKVTFVQNGYADVVIEVKEGEGVAETDIPELQDKVGYTVVWEDVDLSNITADVTVNAVATANSYLVTYDANGGEVETETLEVTYDSAYTLATPTKDGNDFVVWLYDGAAVTLEGTWGIANDVTLVASWQVQEDAVFTITFVQNGQEPIVKTVNAGETLTDIPEAVSKVGYTVAWEEADFSNITSNMTINAVETPLTFSILFNANGGLMASNQTVSYDEDVVVADATRSGYTFKGWFIVDSEGNKTSEQYFGGVWNRLENLSVIAEWEEDFSTNAGYTDRY